MTSPFELMQLKSKQRKQKLINSMRGSTSNHIQLGWNNQDHKQIEKERIGTSHHLNKNQHNRIKVNSSLKKSFYYRKIFNRTIDSHLTPQQFQKFKDRFDQATRAQYISGDKSIHFRNIWSKQHQPTRVISQLDTMQIRCLNKISAVQQNDFDDRKIVEKGKKMQDIMEIAQQRKKQINIDLQILGNKKQLKNKQGSKKKQIAYKNQPRNDMMHPKTPMPGSPLNMNKRQSNKSSPKVSNAKRLQQYYLQSDSNPQNQQMFLTVNRIQKPTPSFYQMQSIQDQIQKRYPIYNISHASIYRRTAQGLYRQNQNQNKRFFRLGSQLNQRSNQKKQKTQQNKQKRHSAFYDIEGWGRQQQDYFLMQVFEKP